MRRTECRVQRRRAGVRSRAQALGQRLPWPGCRCRRLARFVHLALRVNVRRAGLQPAQTTVLVDVVIPMKGLVQHRQAVQRHHMPNEQKAGQSAANYRDRPQPSARDPEHGPDSSTDCDRRRKAS